MERELNIYHEIADSADGWFVDSEAMTPDVFSDAAAECEKGDTLNIHVNSPGGSVFAAVTMTAVIKNLQNRGVVVNAYIDGLAASAASFLVMACDNIYCYPSSMLMIHKPMSFVFGNADDMLEEAETLEKIEASTCMPHYIAKAKASEDEIKRALAVESWLSADEMAEMFDIEVLEGDGTIDSVDASKLRAFKNVPKQLLQIDDPDEDPDEDEAGKEPDEPNNDEPEDDPDEEESNKKPNAPEAHYYDLLKRTIHTI